MARRTLRFARPYSGLLYPFLLVVMVDATVGILNPLICRQIIQQTQKSFSTMAGFIPILLAVSLNKSRRSTADPVAILST
jgi:hypothetical protein